MTHKTAVATGSILALALIWVLWIVLNPGNLASAAALKITAEKTAVDILAELDAGKAFHSQSYVYIRQGPSALKISESDWPQPESWTVESWTVFGEDGLRITDRSIAKDPEGFVWQESARIGDELVAWNFYSGEMLISSWNAVTIGEFVGGLSASVAGLIGNEGEATKRGNLDGLESVIFQTSRPVDPDRDYSSNGGFVIPDLTGLKPESVETEKEFVINNPFISRTVRYAVDENGVRVVVSERKIQYDVVEVDDLSPALLKLPSWASEVDSKRAQQPIPIGTSP